MKDGKVLRPGDRYEIVYTLGVCRVTSLLRRVQANAPAALYCVCSVRG